ncbi:hypothetical protein CKK33_17180 [Mucilaginibacter sp. MD40]|uniref:AraC family transcriptional regulator n=1 Tax=Mucilaginibacter sp. MD40 TaxID=2029590 RepID=UPI000BAC6A07|nr:helix-turn-helix domain-containing protein [Mucilaginibacter sp. MD40]PAW95136.1 hypothetical protein CKK33_17180 [Mucilaginibacter sp. MD40]
MKSKKNIPLVSITAMLAQANEEWHSSEYFISADEYLTAGNALFRPDYYALFICVEGELEVVVDQRRMTLTPYDFIGASPETIIQVTRISPDCKGRFLFFTRSFLLRNIIDPSLLDAFHYLTERVGFCIPLTFKDASPLLQLYEILKEKRGDEGSVYHVEIIRSLFFTFLFEAAAIYKKNPGDARHRIGREQELYQKFTELLVLHDKEEHHLKFYADSLFITPKYLIHAIKNACGKTPGQLIDEAIVAEAKLLLAQRGLSIKRVAELLHFSNPAAFTKFFKKHSALSPSVFRQQPER